MQPSSSSSPRISLPFSDRTLPAAARVVGAMPPDELMRVSVIVKRKQPLDLADLDGRQVSRSEFNSKYAASAEAFDQVRQFAQQHGLTIDAGASNLDRRTLVLTGTAAQMQQAFGVELQQVEHDGRQYRIHQQPASMPQDCASIVDAVLGLDTRPQAQSHLRKLKDLRPAAAVSQSYLPRQVAEIYSFPTDVDGSGETIGILELGGGFTTTDIQQYFQNQNITPPQVIAVSVDGGKNSPTDPSGADSEVMLDIEVVASVAPGAKVVVYFTPNTDQGFIDGLTTAIHDMTNHPSVISISWGSAESNWTQQAMTTLDDACQSAAALGVSITVACGDSGSTDGASDGANHVDFPASSPHVLACGGTKITAGGTKLTNEVVWNDEAQSGGATGGGFSTVFALPTWQQNANVSGATNGGNGRGVPDVAGDAAPETGYSIEVDGQTEVVGGTSAVAPLWAGLIALLNQKLGKSVGFLNPQLYPLLGSTALRDVTQGTNGTYKAAVGWDACTGLGSPVGTTLATKL